MGIVWHEQVKEFHLFNEEISYVMKILPNGQLGHLYFGQRVPLDADYSYLVETCYRPTTAYVFPGVGGLSLEHVRQEYPAYGTTDFRMPAYELLQSNGSRITDFVYVSHKITQGKPRLEGLPATYTEKPEEASTLAIRLRDELLQVEIVLSYTIFSQLNVISRSVEFSNQGETTCYLNRAMSMSLDLPDRDYAFMQLSGWWGRERAVHTRKLTPGIHSIGSLRGQSGHVHNPLMLLKRPHTDEFQGEAIGCSLVYSGNFLAQAEVDTFDVTRLTMGIHPFQFSWQLKAGERFQTPEAVMVYTPRGLNDLSQTFHKLYTQHLVRGKWRDAVRPILINNWEATYFDFDEEKLLAIARKAQAAGIELFVLDDGWFSTRRNDTSGLGDWWANTELLPGGIKGLAAKINALGMKFGLWVELEMVNKDSDLYRQHPDWILHTPCRRDSHGRNQYVLDFSRPVVVDYIYQSIAKILHGANVEYIKWDMNRSITECFSAAYPAEQQGEIFHRYILGVYSLYERLLQEFPHILFESCASGGGRFDPGMLYYAPQAWTSDDSDGIERLKIQYGTSYAYPLATMGTHVSVTPNHQVLRNTSLKLRGDVAYFGTFGYEMDLGKLTAAELAEVREQIAFMKRYRNLIHSGTFYRLESPFTGNITAWMVVARDQRTAIVGYYKILNEVCAPYRRLKLYGLLPDCQYTVLEDGMHKGVFHGSELMHVGLVTTDYSAGEAKRDTGEFCTDFWSRLYVLKACEG